MSGASNESNLDVRRLDDDGHRIAVLRDCEGRGDHGQLGVEWEW